MNKKLYEQAKKNILKEREREFKEEVKEEYEHLVYLSHMKKADVNIMKEIKEFKRKLDKTSIKNMGDSYYLRSLKGSVQEIISTKMYHPKDLKILIKKVNKRIKC
jgi:hypothetical protein